MDKQPVYRNMADGPTIRCRRCGEPRIIPGRMAAHMASVGHPLPFDFDRPAYRALVRALSEARNG
jgi:hypothetical protein